MNSIKIYLITTILAIVVLAIFVSAIQGYNKSMSASEELFDSKLKEIAQLLAEVSPTAGFTVPEPGNHLAQSHQPHIAFRIWNADKKLIVSSPQLDHEISFNFTDHVGYENFDSTRWRVLMQYFPYQKKWIWVAEKQDLRFRLAESVILESIIPSLLVIPFIGGIILLVVGRGMNPIHELAQQIARRKANNLSAIQMNEVPSELIDLTQSVNELFARLESSFDREKRLASDAAHELRTPIAALNLQVQNLLAETPDNPDLKTLLVTSERLSHLTDQILTLNKTTPDLFANQMKDLDITPVIRNVIATHYSLLEDKQQTIEMDAVSCNIESDIFAIETLFSNLLLNAIKYTPTQGKIKVRLIKTDNKVTLEIHDNGPGIPLDMRSRVLERFYRLDGDRNNSSIIGCGLGLSIVHHIVQLHNAEMSLFDSDFGKGLGVRIIFRLPVAEK